MEFYTNNAAQTELLGARLAAVLRRGALVKLYGDLGAGKTAFVRGLAKGLGYQGIVQSPTFSICNVYEGATPLYHFDLYRLGGAEDLESVGFYDSLTEDAVVAAEWAQRCEEGLPRDAISVIIKKQQDSDVRTITIEGVSLPRTEELP